MSKEIPTVSTTVGDYFIEFNSNGGWFEHSKKGDALGGGLWVNGKTVVDYDGVPELPKEVIKGIRELGYNTNGLTL